VPADQTLTQFHRAQSSVHTSLAGFAAWLHFGIRLFQVLAFRHKTSLPEQRRWMTQRTREIRANQVPIAMAGIAAAARARVYNEILQRIHS